MGWSPPGTDELDKAANGAMGSNDFTTAPSFNGKWVNEEAGHITGSTAKHNKETQVEGLQQDEANANKQILDADKTAGDTYASNMQNVYNTYGGKIDAAASKYQGDIEDQAKNSKATYTNTVLPNLKGVMEDAYNNQKGAMTLSQAQDPNNAVASGVRDLYGTQAQGIQNQGLADYGVLAALGGQATASTIGSSGAPMTGGQLQAIEGANMGQAGAAFARAQGAANNLKLQGLEAGQNQSNWAYNAGQQAKNAYSASIGNYEQASNRNNALQQGYSQDIFGTQMGQANAHMGMDSAMNGLNYNLGMQANNRQMAYNNDVYGGQQQSLINQINTGNQQNAAAMQAGGTIIGGIFGGGAGAAAGGQIGAAAGNASAGGTPAASNYGNLANVSGSTASAPTTGPVYSPGAYGGGYGPQGGGGLAGSAPGGGYDGGYTNMMNNPYQRAA